MLLLPLYKSIVRPHYRKDNDKLEKVRGGLRRWVGDWRGTLI